MRPAYLQELVSLRSKLRKDDRERGAGSCDHCCLTQMGGERPFCHSPTDRLGKRFFSIAAAAGFPQLSSPRSFLVPVAWFAFNSNCYLCCSLEQISHSPTLTVPEKGQIGVTMEFLLAELVCSCCLFNKGMSTVDLGNNVLM